MKIRPIRPSLVAMMAAMTVGSAHAQQSRQSLESTNNALINANGRGAITGPIVNGMFNGVITSSGNLKDDNAWTGLNTFSGSTNISFQSIANVKNQPYGALGDNAADDTAAIQGAISAAPAIGAKVFIPAGSYRVSGPLVLPSNTYVQCAPGAVLFEMTSDPVFINTNANMNWATDYTPATLANATDKNITVTDCVVSYAQATSTRISPFAFGAGLGAFTLAQNVTILRTTTVGDSTGLTSYRVANAVRMAKVFNSEVGWNTGTGLYNGGGIWGGSQNVTMHDNTWTIAPNSTNANPYSCSNINGAGTAPNDHQATAHVRYTNNTCYINGGSGAGTGGVVAYNDGALSAGSSVSDFDFSGNRTIVQSGSNNSCFSANGNLDAWRMDKNYFEGCDKIGVILSAHAVNWAGLTNPFTTTSGQNAVVVAIAGVTTGTGSNVVVGNYLSVPVGTPAVGGLTLAGFYPITAVATGQVTIDAGAPAGSNATGGGTVTVATYWGTIRNSVISKTAFKNVSRPNDGLMIVEGPNNVINGVSAEGGTYGALTLTTHVDCCTALTARPNVIVGVQGVAGSGVSSPTGGFAVSGDNLNAWQTNFTPLVLDYASISSTGTWTPVLKFGGVTSDATYTAAGQWWKNGTHVKACAQIAITNRGTVTGSLTVATLPFPPHAGTSFAFSISPFQNSTGLGVAPVLTTGTGGSTTLSMFTDFSWATPVAYTNFSVTDTLNFCGDYETP